MALEDPKRFRIEITFSRGADLSPLEVMRLVKALVNNELSMSILCGLSLIPSHYCLQKNDTEAESLHKEHTLPIMGPERLQEVGSYLTLEKMERMIRPFAMPAEDFPPPSIPQGFSGYFSKSAAVLERLVSLWRSHKPGTVNGGKK